MSSTKPFPLSPTEETPASAFPDTTRDTFVLVIDRDACGEFDTAVPAPAPVPKATLTQSSQ